VGFRDRFLESAADLPYVMFEPPSVAPQGRGRPLIVFLHGSEEKGDGVGTLRKVLVHSLPHLAHRDALPQAVAGAPFPFAIACPQTDRDRWDDDAARVIGLVDELCDEGATDLERCYLTGISMGGGGCWDIAAAAPGRFAAIVPMSGAVRISDETATEPPAWVFHGADDHSSVSADRARKALAAHPNRPRTRVTFVPGEGHSGALWNRLYADPALYEWMLQQRAPSILR
jgi:predicted peptidase